MPITSSPGGTTITGAGIPLYRLLVMRSAVSLQLRTGLKFRGGSVVARACRELGCKRKDVLARLDAAIEAQGKLVAIENDVERRIDEAGR